MRNAVYHKDLGFPDGTRWPRGSWPLTYTQHAREEARGDKYGDFESRLPQRLDLSQGEIIEAQISRDDGRVCLVVVRMRLDCLFDIVLVVKTTGWVWKVLTTYLNRHHDRHKTLDRKRYETPSRAKTHSLRVAGLGTVNHS